MNFYDFCEEVNRQAEAKNASAAVDELNRVNKLYQEELEKVRKEFSRGSMAEHAMLIKKHGVSHLEDAFIQEARKRLKARGVSL